MKYLAWLAISLMGTSAFASGYKFQYEYSDIFESETALLARLRAQAETMNQMYLRPRHLEAIFDNVEKGISRIVITGRIEGRDCTPSQTYYEKLNLTNGLPVGIQQHTLYGMGFVLSLKADPNAIRGEWDNTLLIPVCN